ncbi:MAG TPA: transglutaminase-like domain-containing protein [Bacteroidales bacterium]|nr:transglutaminase-like domain-containing protein [Bacteroidales bacterium]
MNSKEIEAIITLLDDPDGEIFTEISKNLLDKGDAVIPELEKAWERTLNEEVQERIETLINDIQFNTVEKNLFNWYISGGDDLLEGAYWVARFQYPALRFDELTIQIDRIRRDIWLELNNNLTALEKVRIINHILFEVHRFSGNNANFYAPQNSYINQVLEQRKGNPISLAIIYSVISQMLDLPIFGVNLPKNYILAFQDKYAFDEEDNILFYINPFNKGAVLGRREIDYFLEQQKIEPADAFYKPCSNIDTIQRLLLNLILSYEKLGYAEKLTRIQKLLKILKSKPSF